MLANNYISENHLAFYQQAYRQQFDPINRLINLGSYPGARFVIFDCCGWYYKKLFPNCNITSVEKNFWATTRFKDEPDMYDYTFVSKPGVEPMWPQIAVDKSTLVLDRSSFLRYMTIEEFSGMLSHLSNLYSPERVIFRVNPTFIDDNRLVDRIHNLHNLQISGYVVEKFSYDVTTNNPLLEIVFKAAHE